MKENSLVKVEPRRKSRWEDADEFRIKSKDQPLNYSRWSTDKSFTPPALTFIPEFLTQDQLEFILRQYRIEDISQRLTANNFEINDPDIRSPSPEPIYDPKTCQRINTRELRAKERLSKERNTCIEECLKLDPTYKPPPDYKPPMATRKLYIPQFGEATAQSYVALILGPNGKTQKALEKQTNCKIYIRGKGASRGKNYQFDNQEEPMHVLIQAPNEIDAERCCDILEPILNGRLDDEENKKRRLELQQMGFQNRMSLSFKADWCESCGEQGHKKYVCPNKPLAIGWGNEKTLPKKRTLEEELEDFNRETGVDIQLNSFDIMKIKNSSQKAAKKEVEEVGEDDLLPPGVDF